MPDKEDDPFFGGGGKMSPPSDKGEARGRWDHSDIYDDDEEAVPNYDRENYEERSGGQGKPGTTPAANEEQSWMASMMNALVDAPDHAMQQSIRAMLASDPPK